MATDKQSSRYESLGQVSSIPEATLYEGDKGVVEQYPVQGEVAAVRRQHVFRFWPWEIASLIVAFGLIAATYSILSHFDGQKLPEWPYSINLNTLIALISTIMRAAMLVGVAEVISQTKWSWFSRPRPLSHLQYFDEASRSFAGSLSLLFVAPGSLLGVLGALITILSLGIGPFTQQTIKTVPCLQTHNAQTASLPLSHYVPALHTYYRVGAGTFEAEVDMKGTMINGITNPTGNDSAIVPNCATGNCTFAQHNGITHSSIGMCSSCINTTSFIKGPIKSNITYDNYTLPNSMWVSPGSDEAYLNVAPSTLDWASSAFTSEFSSIIDLSIINVTVMALTNATCPTVNGNTTCPISDFSSGEMDVVATSCSLYPCLKNYDATVEKGVLQEKIVSTQPAPVNWVEAGIQPGAIHPYMNFTALQSPCLVDGGWYDLSNISTAPKTKDRVFTGINIDGKNYTAPDECLYKMWYLYAEGLYRFIGYDLLSGTCTYNARQGTAISCDSRWWLASLYNSKQASFNTLSTAFDQFATAVTNKMRTSGSSNYDPTVHELVTGLVNEMTVCTEFQWQWLLMPTILVAATGAVLVAIIVQNLRDRRQPVWKSSLLPLLYYGFDRRAHNEDPNRPVMDLTELNQAASDMRVRLRSGAEAGFVDVTPTIDELIRRKGRDIEVDSLIDGR
ncbi:hypothetical protein F4781DRAFT_445381 [Annulohypoxylon bovei var. microspora]|nr:hypothetical protein F4781DRAFT_445381 [Annulohypoxylon bovei var. microspora]